MGVSLKKDSIDLGIVTDNPEAMVAFYRDVLGFNFEATLDMPGGTKMHRLWCGSSLIKILEHAKAPEAKAPPGGIQGATGYRYWTMIVTNLEEITQQVADSGAKVVISLMDIRPGIRISMVEDPDGNWVEFVEET